ncbi:MAG: ATP-binding cassette domain-containing protein, partial [Hungatella hathewayi]|nr:ATP-binding cassette domain-containing protein [Hungatella hathewayi]
MLYQITDGTVSAGGVTILSHINFEIRGTEKIAVAGKNGAGKTTLLRLLAGELTLDRDDKRNGPGIVTSRKLTVGMMRQQPFDDPSETVEEELLKGCPKRAGTGQNGSAVFSEWDRERFEYEREYDILFTGFGFSKEDKKKKVSSFSGGEQTKIALIRLLLEKPDILLLDEPTNHLDLETVQWLEEYLRQYDKAVVMVSHDRFFLDRTADVIYELAGGKLTRYAGNYSAYREQKLKRIRLQKKAYESQKEELERLNSVVE